MRRYWIFLQLLMLSAPLLKAQEMKPIGQREISIYKVIAKTSEGRVKGILQRTTKDQVSILTDKGLNTIQPESIKSLKIIFDKKKCIPIFNSIAHAVLDVIVDPQYTTTVNSYGQDLNGNRFPLEENETSIGERLLLGGAMITGAILGNEIGKLIPPATMEKFKIGYSKEKYQDIYENISIFAVYTQSSPEYELIQRERLKEAMRKNKLKP